MFEIIGEPVPELVEGVLQGFQMLIATGDATADPQKGTDGTARAKTKIAFGLCRVVTEEDESQAIKNLFI